MQRTLKTIVILCLTLWLAPLLVAQEMIPEDRPSATAPTFFGETGLFQTTSGSTVEKGRFTFGMYLNASRYTIAPAPGLAPPSARSVEDMAVTEDRISASIGYGITDRWEVALQFPLVSIQGNDGDRAGYMLGFPYVGKFADSGEGNLHLGTKFGLLSPSSSHELAVTAYIDFNTGHEDSGIATGNPDYGIGLAWNRGMYYASGYYMNRGPRDSGATPNAVRFRVANEFRADFGVNLPLNRFEGTNWITEINTVWHVAGEQQPDDIVSVTTGLRHWMGDTPWGFSAAIRDNLTALLGDSGSSGFGFLAGVHYAPVRVVTLAPPPPPPVPIPEPLPPAEITPEPVAEPPAPEELRSDIVVFDTSSARVTNIGKALLDDVALRMRQEPAATAIVTGHADGSESMGPDNDLDRRRAEAVRDYLVSRHRIDTSRISVETGGMTTDMEDNRIAVVRLIIR
jgi:outer membrane protein OmpA-like peptidoglycan-associated protein